MRWLLRIVALSTLFMTGTAVYAGDVIDRIVATVNGHVILQSDWDDAVRFEALLDGKPLAQISDLDRGRALDRLIDQELLREQAQGSEATAAPEDEVRARVQEIQKQQSGGNNSGWQTVLARYGFDEKQFETRIAHDLAILRQVEARLRPSIQIAPQTIETYYRDTFLPQLKKLGAQEVPLAEVSGKIREILTQQKVNELFGSWLQTLRSESKISGPGIPSTPPSTGGQGL